MVWQKRKNRTKNWKVKGKKKERRRRLTSTWTKLNVEDGNDSIRSGGPERGWRKMTIMRSQVDDDNTFAKTRDQSRTWEVNDRCDR